MFISGDRCQPLPIGAPGDASVPSAVGGAMGDGEEGGVAIDGSWNPGSADGALQDAAIDVIIDLWCEAGQPVQVCVQYFAYLSSCLQRDAEDLACQDTLIPKTGADVAGIAQLCADNLQRLQNAFR